MRQGFGVVFGPRRPQECTSTGFPAREIQPKTANAPSFHRQTRFPQKIVLDQRSIYHIKGAIGGKLITVSRRTAAERRNTTRILPFRNCRARFPLFAGFS
jgi:hypothetical protein